MNARDALRDNIAAAKAVFDRLPALAGQVDAAAGLILTALKRGNKLLTCGNGGSAADAAHMSTEFVCRFEKERRGYPAVCLNAHGGDLTAIANDYAFDDVFARQVRALGRCGDVLLAVTTSGTSENVRRAIEAAVAADVRTIALLGRDGGVTKGLAEVEMVVAGTVTARIQEAQKLLIHTICQLVDAELPAS
ncbi:MAG: D-sedoheptulose-7-phosphate isomerase [Planctomycetota bacterium]